MTRPRRSLTGAASSATSSQAPVAGRSLLYQEAAGARLVDGRPC